ncbi:MAG TPA: hypothetical protein VNL15_02655 [Dehalococcoidia bacterium]|nr:hypothetical protein [Dehalococcoidia bacterium]
MLSNDLLSEEEWERIYRFKGYGNPRGDFWFVGIEEYGDENGKSLRLKATLNEIEGLAKVHDQLKFPMTTLIPTWHTMSKIILLINGHQDWNDTETCRKYQSQQLGRLDGETFLTDLLPIPKRGDGQWPDWMPFHSWQEYANRLLPRRVGMLKELFEVGQPRFVFCYGKGYWICYKQIFPTQTLYRPVCQNKWRLLG